jgi:hypothetical protein
VEFEALPTGWVDAREPAVRTSSRVEKKPHWNVELRGNIESDFIYVTLLGGDIVKFGYKELRPVTLPIQPSGSGYAMLDVEELDQKGLTRMAEWLEKAQRIWERKAKEKAKKSCPNVISWLNYRNKLSNQNPKAKYLVLFNAAGTNLFSCVIDKQELPQLEIGKTVINPMGFVADSKTYFYETNDEKDAHYLCAILNSTVLNKAIKPYQTRGLFGERDISRRPFKFPVPRFNKNNSNQLELVELSKICHAKVSSLDLKGKRSASARKEATRVVEKELKKIDGIVKKIMPQLS